MTFRHLVTFHLDGEEYAVDILKVREIIRVMDLTRVPNAPAFIEGVINLRGKVVPVIGLRQRFGLPRLEQTPETDAKRRVVVIETEGAVAGLAVDSVSEVLRIPEDSVDPPPALAKIARDCISGVGKLDDRLLILLDAERLLLEPQQQLAAAA